MVKYLFSLIISTVLLLHCSDDILAPAYQYDSSVNGKTVSASHNQQFILELDLAADAGYQWDLSISDSFVVKIDSTCKRPKSGKWNIDGGMTIETFYFKALKRGKCSVNIKEYQNWEPDVEPINKVQFDVIVR